MSDVPFSCIFCFPPPMLSFLPHAALNDKDESRTFEASSCLLEVPGIEAEYIFCMIVHKRDAPFVDLNDFVADIGAIVASHRQRARQRNAEELLQKEAGRRQARDGPSSFRSLLLTSFFEFFVSVALPARSSSAAQRTTGSNRASATMKELVAYDCF